MRCQKLMKNKILAFFLLLTLFAPCFAQELKLPSPSKGDFIYFTADETTFDQTSGNVDLKGNVEIVQDDGKTVRKISGEHILIFTEQQLLMSDGPVKIQDDKGVLTASDVKFDLNSRTVIMQQISGDYYPIRVLSTESTQSDNGSYILKDAVLTCCNREKPHYNLYVGKAKITPGKRLIAYNAIVRIGDIPIFYLPVAYRSLNTDRVLTSYIDFDQSGNTGFGFLTSTVYSAGQFRAIGNLDYYTKSGIGYGMEVAYHDPQKFRGSLQAYTIYDKVQDKQRWGVNGGYWWEAYDSSDSLNKGTGAIYFSQLELREVSDADFNDDFFRSNPYVVSPDKLARASIVRQSNASTFRVSYTKRSQLNENDKTFSNSEEILPKVDLLFNPFALGNTGIINNVSFGFNNTKIEDYDYVQYAHGRWVSQKDFKLHPNFTLTPKVFYDQQVILKDPNNNNDDSFVGRYGTDINFRSDLITGMLDIGYRYTRKMQSSSLPPNPQNPNADEEENLFYIQNYFLPTPNLYFRLGTGYDINDNNQSWDPKYRVVPIIAEAGFFSPITGTNFFVQNVYDINNGNQAFIMDTTFMTKSGSYANLGIANYSTDRSSYLVTTKFVLAPKGFTWRADMGVDFDLNGDAFHAYSKHIRIYKDFHDVGLMLGVRDRNQNLSFTFRINVFCGKQEKRAVDQAIDDYWYPWRDERLLRDNF